VEEEEHDEFEIRVDDFQRHRFSLSLSPNASSETPIPVQKIASIDAPRHPRRLLKLEKSTR